MRLDERTLLTGGKQHRTTGKGEGPGAGWNEPGRRRALACPCYPRFGEWTVTCQNLPAMWPGARASFKGSVGGDTNTARKASVSNLAWCWVLVSHWHCQQFLGALRNSTVPQASCVQASSGIVQPKARYLRHRQASFKPKARYLVHRAGIVCEHASW